MKLICEQNDSVITEAIETPKGKDYFINGIFMQAELENRNGRVYPKEILTREVNSYNRNYVSQRRSLGELNHPAEPSINMHLVSHLITELFADGNNFIGKAKILDTPNGHIVKAFIDEEVKLGVSSRGMGSLKEVNGVQQVQDDFVLSTVDIVADLSASHAFVNGIMEGKEWIWQNGLLTERKCEEVKKHIKAVPSKRLDEEILKQWTKFINKL